MIRVVADTNVYISALEFGGKRLTILRMADRGEIRLLIPDPVISEITRVLKDTFDWPDQRISEARSVLSGLTKQTVPNQTPQIVAADPDDDRMLECAVAGKATFLVTGDKALLRLKHYGTIRIVGVTEFLQSLSCD